MAREQKVVTVTLAEAVPLILAAYHAREPVLLLGPPGVGKTAILHQVADMLTDYFNGDLHQCWERRMLQYAMHDLVGIPFPNEERTKTTWLPADFFPTEGKGLFLMDEITALSKAMQATCYSIIERNGVGSVTMPKDIVPVAAGNRLCDGAVANTLSTAITSRFGLILEIKVDPVAWCEWAINNGVPQELVYFIKLRPELLHQFDPKRAEIAFPCPRTVVKLGNILPHLSNPTQEFRASAASCGEGFAREFVAFLKLFRNLPSIDAILADPATADLPEQSQVDVTYAISAALARHADENNIGAVITYLKRLPQQEFLIFSLRDAVVRNPSIAATRDFIDLVTSDDVRELFN